MSTPEGAKSSQNHFTYLRKYSRCIYPNIVLPDCLASCALILSPVRTIFMARDLPTAWVSLWVPPEPAEADRINLNDLLTLKKEWKDIQDIDKNVFTRNCTQQDLWLAKLRLLPSEDDVAHHRQLTASTQLKQQKDHNKRQKHNRKWRLSKLFCKQYFSLHPPPILTKYLILLTVCSLNVPLRKRYTRQTHWRQQSQVSSLWTLCSSEPKSFQKNTPGRFDSASL